MTNIFFYHGATALEGQDLLTVEDSWSHSVKTHHTWQDSSGWVIRPAQRPLPDNTQHSQKIDIHAPVAIETTIPASERPQTHALDRTANITNITCTKVYTSDVERPDIGSCDIPKVCTRLPNVWCVYFGAYNVSYIN